MRRTHDVVDVWCIRLSADDEAVEVMTDTLDATERARAARFRYADHRRRYVVAHGAVRAILGQRLGVHPSRVPWIAGRNGKPALSGIRQEINLSHSGDLALLAVADREVGVDVERVRPELETDVLARRFSPTEAAVLQALPVGRRGPAFTTMWTRKESLVKACGARLGQGLGTEIAHDAVVRLPGEAQPHRVRDLTEIAALPGVGRHYRAAVALAGTSPYDVRLQLWNAEEYL